MAFTAILGAVGSIAGAAGGMMGGKKKGGEAGAEGGGGKAGGTQDKKARKQAKKQAGNEKKAQKAHNKQMKLQTEALQKIANKPPAAAPQGDQVNLSISAAQGGAPDPWGTGGGMPGGLLAGLTHNFS